MTTDEVRPRIVLADDHPLILQKVMMLLQDKYEIAATASDGAHALRIIQAVNPHIVVLDLIMPIMNGLQVARRLRDYNHPCGIIFLTIQQDPDYLQAAREMNASYVFKSRVSTDLLLAIEETLAGRVFISPCAARSVQPHFRPD